MAGADGQAGEEDRFVVVVVAGEVDRELPVVGGADVAQPAQFVGGGVGQRRVDVAEGPAVADLQAGDLRPAFAGPDAQPRSRKVLVESGYLATTVIFSWRLGPAQCRAGHWRGYGIKNACLCQADTRLSCLARNRPC